MTSLRIHCQDEAALVDLGQRLAEVLVAKVLGEKVLAPGLLITLAGELGAGKTTFTRGVARGLGHRGAVKSPTYTLVEPYRELRIPLYHFDLYRLGDPEELEYLGIRDYFDGHALCVVEWPERGAGVLPEADLAVSLSVLPGGRELCLESRSPAADVLLAAMAVTQ